MKKITVLAAAAFAVLFACTGKSEEKYRLNLDGYGLKTEKKEYRPGEEVRVTFNIIATDTDYKFTLDCDDVKMKQDYTPQEGYILTFGMPEHDVTLKVTSRNSMECEPRNRPDTGFKNMKG
jgi:uncharacterized protein YfaS (alpha-2-macroglobulin family)